MRSLLAVFISALAACTLMEGEEPLSDFDRKYMGLSLDVLTNLALHGSPFEATSDGDIEHVDSEDETAPEEDVQDESGYSELAEVFGEAVMQLAPLTDSDYEVSLSKLSGDATTHRPDCLDPTADITRMSDLVTQIFPHRLRFFESDAQLVPYLDVTHKLRLLDETATLDLSLASTRLRDYVMALKTFVRSMTRDVYTEEARRSYAEFNRVVASLAEADDLVFAKHANAKISAIFGTSDENGQKDDRISRLLRAFQIMYPQRFVTIRDPHELVLVESLFSSAVSSGKSIAYFNSADARAKTAMKEMISVALRDVFAQSMQIVRWKNRDGAISRFLQYMQQMEGLRVQDFTNHVLRFAVVAHERAGSTRTFPSRGILNDVIHGFGRELSLIAPYRHILFADNARGLELFNKVHGNFAIFWDEWLDYSQSPSIPKARTLVDLMRKYIVSVHSFMNPAAQVVVQQQEESGTEVQETKRPRIESIGKSDDHLHVDPSPVRCDLAPSPTSTEAYRSSITESLLQTATI